MTFFQICFLIRVFSNKKIKDCKQGNHNTTYEGYNENYQFNMEENRNPLDITDGTLE